MDQVNAGFCFISKASCTKSAQSPVAQGLFSKTGSMESILIPYIKHQGLNKFVVTITKCFFENQCTNDYIYGSIGTGSFKIYFRLWREKSYPKKFSPMIFPKTYVLFLSDGMCCQSATFVDYYLIQKPCRSPRYLIAIFYQIFGWIDISC